MTTPVPPGPPSRLRDLDEDEILARILPLLHPGEGDAVLVGPGDDAAVVTAPSSLIVTTDSMIRGRDWRDDWSTARDVAHKLGAQNVSDIAAMGGVASAAVLSVTADPDTSLAWVEEFATGLGEWCRQAGAAVVGGDLSSAPAGVLHVSLTMWGDLEGRPPVLRSGARAGDVLVVCGSLGWSSAGLSSFEAGDHPRPEPGRTGPARSHPARSDPADGPAAASAREAWRAYHRRPAPPWRAGPVAAAAGATSMIDISDGLVRDAGRVARASGVGLDLDRGALEREFVAGLTVAMAPEDAWRHVLGGGEEHSLLATFPPGTRLPDSPESPWQVIGSVVPGEGVTLDGRPLEVLGWDHFKSGPRQEPLSPTARTVGL